mgnify:CR=1 FL=1
MLNVGSNVFGDWVVEEEIGSGGFGYDPIFMVDEYNKTTAELSMEEKNKISHRAKALRAIKEQLAKE